MKNQFVWLLLIAAKTAAFAFALSLSAHLCAGPIHDAARDGKVEKVKSLIKADQSVVNAKNTLGATPLHTAAGKGDKKIAELLIDESADMKAKDLWGDTPLDQATGDVKTYLVNVISNEIMGGNIETLASAWHAL